ncbi:MAG: AAA family ATPase, partial [Clostridia bacterium]|nr:AAA family ATPase [Clostridia bacterium]
MKLYLESFSLASRSEEEGFILNYPYQLEMQCYSHTNVYPFKIFPQKRLRELSFEPITVLYGGNGSGKSTLLNIIAQKLGLSRFAPFNDTPYFVSYLQYCDYTLAQALPKESRLIASDDVFDLLLERRTVNEKIDRKRNRLFEEYDEIKDTPFRLNSLSDYSEFKRRNEAKRQTKSVYTAARLPKEFNGMSNGESAFSYFTNEIKEDALYLLDEPENSLSPKLQTELAAFLADSARFYGCQFIISTHSPFLLAMKGVKIYDLDTVPVGTRRWSELENI